MKRTLSAKIYPCLYSPSEYDLNVVSSGSDDEARRAISFSAFPPSEPMKDRADIAEPVGVTIEIDTDRVVTEAIAAMRQEQQNVRAQAEEKAMKIEMTIQKLLAIGMNDGFV